MWPVDRSPPRCLCPWGFSKQEYWSGLPCPSPGYLPNPWIEPTSLMSSALAGKFFTRATWEAQKEWWYQLDWELWRMTAPLLLGIPAWKVRHRKKAKWMLEAHTPASANTETLHSYDFYFNWGIAASHYCVGFCSATKRISSMCTYIPSILGVPATPHPPHTMEYSAIVLSRFVVSDSLWLHGP